MKRFLFGLASLAALPWHRNNKMVRPAVTITSRLFLSGWLAEVFAQAITLGETDELGVYATQDSVHVHDLHATILYLLGLDHKQLTYRFQGRDFRLTDVYGNVMSQLLA